MISWSDCFTRAAGLLYRTQMRMTTWEEEGDKGGGKRRGEEGEKGKGVHLLQLHRRAVMAIAKLKLMVFYEQVCPAGSSSGSEFRFTVGQLAKISQKSMAEFAIIYSGLIFYVAKMIRRGWL